MKKLVALTVLALVAGNVEGMRTWTYEYNHDAPRTLEQLRTTSIQGIKMTNKELEDLRTKLLNKVSASTTHLPNALGHGLASYGLTKAAIASFKTAISSSDFK